MRDLKEVLEQNKEKYIEELKKLVGIDTHDLGHGIDGGLENRTCVLQFPAQLRRIDQVAVMGQG